MHEQKTKLEAIVAFTETSEWKKEFPKSQVYVNEDQTSVTINIGDYQFALHLVKKDLVQIQTISGYGAVIDRFTRLWSLYGRGYYILSETRRICAAPKKDSVISHLLAQKFLLTIDTNEIKDSHGGRVADLVVRANNDSIFNGEFNYFLRRVGDGWQLIESPRKRHSDLEIATLPSTYFQFENEGDLDASLKEMIQARRREEEWLGKVQKWLSDRGQHSYMHPAKLRLGENIDSNVVSAFCSIDGKGDQLMVNVKNEKTIVHYFFKDKNAIPVGLQEYLYQLIRRWRYKKRLSQA